MNLLWKFLKSKYVIWGVVILAAVGGYFWYSSTKSEAAAPRYAFTSVQKDTIVSTVNGSGQVSGNRQLDIKPKVGGEVNKILVKVGDAVTTGTPLMEIDRTEALKSVRDAAQAVDDSRISLQSAQLSLKKSLQPADAASLLQAQNSLAKAERDYADLKAGPTAYELMQAQADVESAKRNIQMSSDGVMPQVERDAYDGYVTALQSSIQTLQKSLTDADSILGLDKAMVKDSLARMFSIMNSNAKLDAINNFHKSKTSVDLAVGEVNALRQTGETVENIRKASSDVSIALNDVNDLLIDLTDGLQATLSTSDLSASEISSLKSTIDGDRSNVNSKTASILSQDQSIRQAEDSYTSAQISYTKIVNSYDQLKAGPTTAELATAEESVKQAQAQLDKLKAGADPIDLQISQNSISQRQSSLISAQNKLADAQQALDDYTVKAPFDGVVAKVAAQESEDASAGTAVATLVTSQQVATISLNEVDVAKVKVGQKATLTFDAVDGLSLTGEVAEVSQLGTVTQGVVNYDIKIAFDSQDERIKSGMSVSVSIITQVTADVLALPNSAIKTQGEQQYVETLDVTSSTQLDASGYYQTAETPKRVLVKVGVANDTLTEITEGLTEGQQVVSQTIKNATTATAAQSTNLLRLGGSARPPGN